MRKTEPTELAEPTEVVETAEVKEVEKVVESNPELQATEEPTPTNGEQPPLIEEAAAAPEVEAESVGQTHPRKRVSALAIVSVLCGLLGFLGITSLLGLGLGIAALRQMAVNPQLSGRHLAILGVCLSVFWMVLLLAMGSFIWVGLTLVKALFNAVF